MKRTRRVAGLVIAALLVAVTVAPMAAQVIKGDQTASQFYTAFRAAFDTAKSIDDLLPYMSKKNVDQVKATPPDQRSMMFKMMKEVGAITDLKIVKETKTATGATLEVEALGPDKTKTHGTVEILKEGGAWKVGQESWKS